MPRVNALAVLRGGLEGLPPLPTNLDTREYNYTGYQLTYDDGMEFFSPAQCCQFCGQQGTADSREERTPVQTRPSTRSTSIRPPSAVPNTSRQSTSPSPTMPESSAPTRRSVVITVARPRQTTSTWRRKN